MYQTWHLSSVNSGGQKKAGNVLSCDEPGFLSVLFCKDKDYKSRMAAFHIHEDDESNYFSKNNLFHNSYRTVLDVLVSFCDHLLYLLNIKFC